jgi:hypothetical protein
MADQKNVSPNANQQTDTNQQQEAHPSDQSRGAAAGAKTGTTQSDVDAQRERGGDQSNQGSGDARKGAQNQVPGNRNP